MDIKNNTLLDIMQQIHSIADQIEKDSNKGASLDIIEEKIFKTLLATGCKLLNLYIEMVSVKVDTQLDHFMNCKYENKGKQQRSYCSIFGNITFDHDKYYIPEQHQVIFPLDVELGIDKQKVSFVLQDWIGFNSSDTDYRSSVELLNKIFGYNFQSMQSQRISNNLSEFVDEYYDNVPYENKQKEGDFYAVSFDDKGVPIKASELGMEAQSNGVRLGKGQKRGVKKHCTVSACYSFNERIRAPEDVIRSLFKEGAEKNTEEKVKESVADETSKMAENKHLRGFLADKTKAIEYGFEHVAMRNPENKKIVVLIDGDKGLRNKIEETIVEKNISFLVAALILDFIHVTEYVWKVANAHFGEKHTLEKLNWVKTQCLLLLKSEMKTVLLNLDSLLERNKGKPSKKEVIEKTIKYFNNHHEMMDYKTYLEQGFPISTGVVESACGHFVQSRMERNGMHWSFEGAQNMLNIRAINKNKDWEQYIEFYKNKKMKIFDFKYQIPAA